MGVNNLAGNSFSLTITSPLEMYRTFLPITLLKVSSFNLVSVQDILVISATLTLLTRPLNSIVKKDMSFLTIYL